MKKRIKIKAEEVRPNDYYDNLRIMEVNLENKENVTLAFDGIEMPHTFPRNKYIEIERDF